MTLPCPLTLEQICDLIDSQSSEIRELYEAKNLLRDPEMEWYEFINGESEVRELADKWWNEQPAEYRLDCITRHISDLESGVEYWKQFLSNLAE